MKFSNKVYDILKWLSLCILPAVATFYCAISEIWHLPYSEQIVGTIAAVETLIGVAIGISTYEYNKNNKDENSSN